MKGSSVGLGIREILRELNCECEKIRVRIKTDASAAKGIACRRGLGKVRHIEVTQLWVQEKVQKNEIEVEKIKPVRIWQTR